MGDQSYVSGVWYTGVSNDVKSHRGRLLIVIIMNELTERRESSSGKAAEAAGTLSRYSCDVRSVAFSDVRHRLIVGTVTSSALFGTKVETTKTLSTVYRLFRTFAAATGKARASMALFFDSGTCGNAVAAERNRLRQLMSAAYTLTRCIREIQWRCVIQSAVDEDSDGIQFAEELEASGDHGEVDTQRSLLRTE